MNPPRSGVRKPRPLPIDIRPVLVSHDVAAAMLGQISPRTLDQLVAAGRLRARQITKGRVGYLTREIEALAESLPEVVPGIARTPALEQDA